MEPARPQRKILRSPSVKRKSKSLPVNQRVQLERILGVTVSSNAGLSCDSNNGTIAYPAGCVVVLFNPRRNKQSHIFNTSKKTITAVSFSPDGKHLVTGETGHQPAVRVWDVEEKVLVSEFHGHKFGINCVAFSPNMKEVVSVGTQHDMMIIVWNWKTGNKVASNKVSSKVSAVAFAEDGKSFITVGNRHVKFWYLEDRRSKINQTVPLMGRSGILGDQRDNFFCDVAAGLGSMCGRFFVITQSGLLCEFNVKRQLDKWVELRTKSANCVTAGREYIFVGCAEGVVRVFSATTLCYLCSLPRPHHLGVEVTTATSPSAMVSNRDDAKYPDTKAIAVDDDHKKVTCIYNDRSVYIWDVHDLKRVGKAWSFLYHSGCIWALEVYPPLEDGTKAMLPPGSFLTASGDDTVRVWNLNTHMPENTAYKRNIYSNELLKIVYSDPSLTSLCNVDYNPAGATDKTDTSYDGKNGVRSIRVSPDGTDLASGDRQGNVRIYDMKYLNEKRSVEAHESDVMCLEYSYTNSGHLLATAGRDRLIHVFDVEQNYGLLQTIGDHSSSITAVRFTDNENKLRMISCGADKSILLRNAVNSPDFQFQLEQHLATKISLYDMVIDPSQKCLATACQDRNVRLYNIQTTKEKKCYRGSLGDEGILLRIHLDPSGTFAATTCTDKNVCILDFNTGDLMATMYGHSEVITGVKFANDLKHVISVSADGCIFVWRLPSEMTTQIKGRLLELGKKMRDTDFIRSDQSLMPNPVMLGGQLSDGTFPVVKSASVSHIPMMDRESVDGREEDGDDEDDEEFHSGHAHDDTASQASLAYRFSVGQLPNWAKAKFDSGNSEGSDSSQDVLQPKGRWAQRLDRNVEFKSQLDLTSDEDNLEDRRRTLSNDGCVDNLNNLRRETMVLGKQLGNKNLPVIGDNHRASTGDLRAASTKSLRDSETPHYRDAPNHYRSETSLSSSKRWTDRFDDLKSSSLELDDTDDLETGSDTTEVIYPPTDGDTDLFASSYKIFAVDSVKKKPASSIGNISNLDDESESTDPISLEDEDDPNDETLPVSNPTTPSEPEKDFLSRTPDKEDFVRENFEDDSFTPIPMEKFTSNVEKLERQALINTKGPISESTPFSPRLSLSARFMSRSQLSTFKNASSLTTAHRADNWFSRNKVKMARAMDETRKSLLAMNLRRNSTESDSPEKEDLPSPPTRLEKEEHLFPDLSKGSTAFSSSPPAGTTRDSTSSTLIPGTSPPVFEPKMVDVKQLAVTEEIERTATMLRHQKQANISATFSSEHLHPRRLSDLEASPQDLSERDQSSPNPRHSSSKLASTTPSQWTSSSGHTNRPITAFPPSFHPLPITSVTVNNSVMSKGDEDNSSTHLQDKVDSDEENMKSVRERIAQYNTQKDSVKDVSSISLTNSNNVTQARSARQSRRILPLSPGVPRRQSITGDNQHSQSDTGVGSESDTDTTPCLNTATYSIGTKPNLRPDSQSQKADRSRLALSLQSPSPSAQACVSQCQTVLKDFKSHLDKVKDLFYQVDGKADPASHEVMTMLAEVIHETQCIVTDLAAKTPSPPHKNEDSQHNMSSTFSSRSPQTSSSSFQNSHCTFHVDSNQGSHKSDVSAVKDDNSLPSKIDVHSSIDQTNLLSATKDMLQPLVNQLSQDLSQEIMHLIKKKIEQSS